jgi:hypothetical protein
MCKNEITCNAAAIVFIISQMVVVGNFFFERSVRCDTFLGSEVARVTPQEGIDACGFEGEPPVSITN